MVAQVSQLVMFTMYNEEVLRGLGRKFNSWRSNLVFVFFSISCPFLCLYAGYLNYIESSMRLLEKERCLSKSFLKTNSIFDLTRYIKYPEKEKQIIVRLHWENENQQQSWRNHDLWTWVVSSVSWFQMQFCSTAYTLFRYVIFLNCFFPFSMRGCSRNWKRSLQCNCIHIQRTW